LLIEGLVKLFPLAKELPPVAAAYHFTVPVPEAESVTVPGPQRLTFDPLGAAGTELIIA